ncbi:serine hydrolase domain-containing protein [uncultured Maribacter sp.]|uniref:serine hydrolase domain-containing protein n=1 Tax=uncultured Maribacter sp. TaxID=431308 RepID=UPI0030DCD740|tara:strand:- start:2193 stop:3386 length:1194 start_codon:yes stop_codon:yes gene_type:complete
MVSNENIIRIILLLLISHSCKSDDIAPYSEPTNDIEIGAETDESSSQINSNTGENSSVSNTGLEDITSGFRQLMTIYGFSGAQVAITRNNKIVYLESFGKADIDAKITVNDNSLFRIGSISKPITLTAISKLVADGQLSLDDRVFGPSSILGTEFGVMPYDSEEESITIEHLIEHTAGFTNFPIDIMFDDNDLTQAELITKVLDERSLASVPGSRYEFSNFGYSLLGRVIEKVTRKTYESYVKEFILAPMEISKMAIGLNTKSERIEEEVTYYTNFANPYIDPYGINVKRMDSHGGWIASAKDLALFAMKSDNEASVPDFLEPKDKLSYLKRKSWNHNGYLPGSISVLEVGYPTSFVVLVNKSAPDFLEIIQAIRNFMREKVESRTDWPKTDVVNDL